MIKIKKNKTKPSFFSFATIKNCWIKFKAQFLEDNSDFSEQANNIISRCVKELDALIMIEEQYKDCGLLIPSPYEFFLKVIDAKTYTPQTKATGVNIFKYKLTAAANFKFQFVIDASQKNLEIQNRRLTFLNATKRAKLHLIEDDRTQNSTDVFLKLYAKQTDVADADFVHFSYAEESFAGSRKVNFPHLDAGTYRIRAIKDDNGNRKWDSGNYWEHRQAEESRYFAKSIKVRENWDFEETFKWQKQ